MLETRDILETINMIDNENLDVRTITMGISLLDCIDEDIDKACTKVYDKICRNAKDLVKTGEDIQKEFGIPIIHKRISVTPIGMVAAPCQSKNVVKFAHTLDKAAKELGVNFIGGYSALVQKGFASGDYALIESIPQTISMVKELAVGAVKGEIDLLTLAKTVLKGAFGDYYHVARYIDTLDPFVSKTDAQVYRYGRAVGSVATDVALALVGATVVDKVADILQSSKAGQKILNLAKKAQGYFEDLTYKNKQQLSTTLYQLTDEAGGIQRSITKGSWQDVNESMSKASRDYQAAITGHTGQAWVQNGVKFDGYSNGILIETKAKYSQFVDSSGTFRSWFKGADGFVDQARRQLAAANGGTYNLVLQREGR